MENKEDSEYESFRRVNSGRGYARGTLLGTTIGEISEAMKPLKNQSKTLIPAVPGFSTLADASGCHTKIRCRVPLASAGGRRERGALEEGREMAKIVRNDGGLAEIKAYDGMTRGIMMRDCDERAPWYDIDARWMAENVSAPQLRELAHWRYPDSDLRQAAAEALKLRNWL